MIYVLEKKRFILDTSIVKTSTYSSIRILMQDSFYNYPTLTVSRCKTWSRLFWSTGHKDLLIILFLENDKRYDQLNQDEQVKRDG